MISKRVVACDVCGSTRHQELYADELGDTPATTSYEFTPETRKTYRIVKCLDCDMIFTNPMPSLIHEYEEQVDHTYLGSQRQRISTAERSVRRLRKYASEGRLLDVGCATGIFLDAASRFFQVEGLELSRWAAAIASQRHPVHQVTLADYDVGAVYDAVTLWGVIEHLEHPREELKRVNALLKPGGIVALYTGDVEAWLPRLLGKRWWWFQGMHLQYFSERTLARLLRETGFEVLDSELMAVDFELHSLAVSFNRYAVGRWLKPVLSAPGLRNIQVPLRLSGEMLIFARKSSWPSA